MQETEMFYRKTACAPNELAKLGFLAALGGALVACVAPDGTAPEDVIEVERAEAATAALFPAAISGTHPGYVVSAPTDEANRCALDPVYDIDVALALNPNYVVAYRSGKSACGVPAPTNHDGELIHRQGIQRLHRDGKNYLLVSASTRDGVEAGFEVVEMGSRVGNAALGSGGVTPTTAPNCADHVVSHTGYPYPDLRDHAGGLQVLGRYAAVALEDISNDNNAGFLVADLANPASPTRGPLITRQRGDRKEAGSVAMTRLNDGTYMTMVFGHGASDVEVFVSNGTTMSLTSSFWTSKWRETTPGNFPSYQNIQLVTRCDGRLYALGTHNQSGSDDWADLWQVTLSTDGNYNPTFTKVANANVFCRSANTGDTRYCNFSAGGGAYVAGNGRMIVYGVEHYDDAYPGNGHGVKVREFATN
ncbi:hypothetical protein WMF28_38250 [Sorangium sp. So ce590]|uniref:hypothetical protein n=1 Tax=Sorangium sp. So ce590 TaxID=3133317 RepID=UPI003F61E8A0